MDPLRALLKTSGRPRRWPLENSRTARGWVSAVDTDAKIIRLKGKNDEVSFLLENSLQ